MKNRLSCFIILLFLFTPFCFSLDSEIYSLYLGFELNSNYAVLLNKESRVYVYQTDTYTEEGVFKLSRDTLFVFPKYQILTKSDTVYKYECDCAGYFNSDTSKCIEKRIYLIGNDRITNKTLEYYYPNDSTSCNLYNDSYPLKKIKVKQIKKEKETLKARQMYENYGK